MSEKTLEETIIYACINHFCRETQYWRRINVKGTRLDWMEISAKEKMNEQLYQLAAGAALRANRASIVEDLNWEYKELTREVQDHKQRVLTEQ